MHYVGNRAPLLFLDIIFLYYIRSLSNLIHILLSYFFSFYISWGPFSFGWGIKNDASVELIGLSDSASGCSSNAPSYYQLKLENEQERENETDSACLDIKTYLKRFTIRVLYKKWKALLAMFTVWYTVYICALCTVGICYWRANSSLVDATLFENEQHESFCYVNVKDASLMSPQFSLFLLSKHPPEWCLKRKRKNFPQLIPSWTPCSRLRYSVVLLFQLRIHTRRKKEREVDVLAIAQLIFVYSSSHILPQEILSRHS